MFQTTGLDSLRHWCRTLRGPCDTCDSQPRRQRVGAREVAALPPVKLLGDLVIGGALEECGLRPRASRHRQRDLWRHKARVGVFQR